MKKLSFKIRGVAPLLCHNGQTADPLNSFARSMKKLSGKKNKTEADYQEMSNVEFLAGLYIVGGAPGITSQVLEATLIEAAKKSKQGKLALAGVFVEEHAALEYDGPKDPQELLKDPNFKLIVPVRVQKNKVMRTRPKFENWSLAFTITYDERTLNEEAVKDLVKVAGESVGLGDWRPKFGRFEVVK